MPKFTDILAQFREMNTDFLYSLMESMSESGLLNDSRIKQAMYDIRIEDFITFEMIQTFLPEEHAKADSIEDIPSEVLVKILAFLFMSFYQNRPLAFYNHEKYGRTTSAPHMIAIMAQVIGVEEGDNILILGSKSGYFECVVQAIDANVKLHIVEKVPEIYEITRGNLERLGTGEVNIHLADPILDLPELIGSIDSVDHFDKIFITGYLAELPRQLMSYLELEGQICGPFGSPGGQDLVRYLKIGTSNDAFTLEPLMQVIYSPLITDWLPGEDEDNF